MSPRPRNDPAWYHSKACFYIFNFVVELAVIALYILVRVDLRFYVPNGSRRAGDYSGRNLPEKKISDESLRTTGGTSEEVPSGLGRIISEGTVFDEAPEKGMEHEAEHEQLESKKNGVTSNGENAV